MPSSDCSSRGGSGGPWAFACEKAAKKQESARYLILQ